MLTIFFLLPHAEGVESIVKIRVILIFFVKTLKKQWMWQLFFRESIENI
jgi:hypothetical protein